MTTDRRKPGSAPKGLVYGLLVGWVAGILWWTSLVIIFGLQPDVTGVTVDSTGRHETRVTGPERIALIPLRAIPWAVVAGVVGEAVRSGRSRASTRNRSKAFRVNRGMAYGLLAGWIVGTILWTSLAITLGPSGSVYEHGGVIRVEHYYPVFERIANIGWVVPWALAGAVAASFIDWIGGWLEIITYSAGMVGGIAYAIFRDSFDGWLVLTIPVYAFMGIGIGAIVGAVVRATIRVLPGRMER